MKKITLLLALCLGYFGVWAQKYSSGPQVLSFYSVVDGTDQPYALYLPPNFNENKKYPFVVMLHGAGSNHRLALRRVFGKSNFEGENDVMASSYFPEWKDVDYIVAAPLARGTMGYQGVAEKDVWDMIADVKRRFKIDEDRTYLTGLSMGGGGTMWIGLTQSDFWAAIAPVCPAPPDGTQAYINNVYNLPVHFFHGEKDPVVSLASVNNWVEEFKKHGAKVEYKVYPNVLHNSWEDAYKEGQVFRWFSQFKRNPSPSVVKFSTPSLKHNKLYWIQFENLVPGNTAKAVAEVKPGNKVIIESENLEAFRILPTVPLSKNKNVEVVWNGKSYTLKNFQGGELLGEVANNGKSKSHPGEMIEVFADRHIYVYGTADNPSQEELANRRKIAEEAANWSYYRGEYLGRVMVFPRVLADREVKEWDKANSHLVVFGTEETNSVLKDLNLPLALKNTENASLSFVYPHKDRLILVNSGKPFWQMEDKGNPALRVLRNPAKGSILSYYGDWAYEQEGKITHGYFTSEWKLKEADKNTLKSYANLKVN